MNKVPVITIDGPAASGKGSVSRRVAAQLGWHYLDSGAMYRLCGLAALQAGVALDDMPALDKLAQGLNISFTEEGVELNGLDVSEAIRTEEVGEAASRVAAIPGVRTALLQRQRDFRQAPGLVADGRDMGTVVFPDAALKVFLTAGVEIRAQRRARQIAIDPDDPIHPIQPPGAESLGGAEINANQLISKENYATLHALFQKELDNVLQDLVKRDERDSARSSAPLKAADDAKLLDTTHLGIAEAVAQVMVWHRSI